jgi:hypothetical protein
VVRRADDVETQAVPGAEVVAEREQLDVVLARFAG